jgi:hypothetical protein
VPYLRTVVARGKETYADGRETVILYATSKFQHEERTSALQSSGLETFFGSSKSTWRSSRVERRARSPFGGACCVAACSACRADGSCASDLGVRSCKMTPNSLCGRLQRGGRWWCDSDATSVEGFGLCILGGLLSGKTGRVLAGSRADVRSTCC